MSSSAPSPPATLNCARTSTFSRGRGMYLPRQLLSAIRRKWVTAKGKAWVRLAELVIWSSTYQAARRLRETGPITVLIDNSSVAHGVTHETAWISTGTKLWGGAIPIETGYSSRIPVHSHTNRSQTYREITYLIGIAELARKGLIKLVRSSELRAEAWRQPPGLFMGYGWEDLSIFHGIDIPSVDNRPFSLFGGVEDQRVRINRKIDEPFHSLLRYFPEKQNFDVWHVHTAHKHEAFCFLTMDFKFHRQFHQSRKRSGFPALRSEPMLPSELAARLGLRPIHSFLMSYRKKRFFVRHDLFMPTQQRRSRHEYRRSKRSPD
jgi:hypothetical protein